MPYLPRGGGREKLLPHRRGSVRSLLVGNEQFLQSITPFPLTLRLSEGNLLQMPLSSLVRGMGTLERHDEDW